MYKHSFALLALLAVSVSAQDATEVGDEIVTTMTNAAEEGEAVVDGADQAMEESLRTLEMFEELINVFCNEEPQDEGEAEGEAEGEGEGRRLDGHEEGEAVAEAAEGEISGGDI